MAELDTVVIKNPTNEDFTQRYNGEPYTIKAGEEKPFAQFVAYHIAHHLAVKIIEEEFRKINGKLMEKEGMNGPLNAQLAQMLVFDNPKRRIAWYKILGDQEKVQKMSELYCKKGFIGDMNEYLNFVEKSLSNAKDGLNS